MRGRKEAIYFTRIYMTYDLLVGGFEQGWASYMHLGRETARRLGWEQLELFIFLVALPLVLARFAREFRGYAARAPGSTKLPCYAGYRSGF